MSQKVKKLRVMLYEYNEQFKLLPSSLFPIDVSLPLHIHVCCRCQNIFTIQQELANITGRRELNLDLARQYFELLYLTPDVSTIDPLLTGIKNTKDTS